MTLYVNSLAFKGIKKESRAATHHFKCPHPSDPHLELPLNSLDIVQLNTLPPTSPCWFPPEEQELLCHSDCVARQIVTPDIGAETCERNTADDCFVRFASAMTPAIVVVEAANCLVSLSSHQKRC